ncbi:MAG: outer membrane protein assembly factor BamA [Bdellovibrionales bacterium CG12_big_fil_rev_8_21_14_0_65_38_15]|nr:MAG: outer membrane protein assembly factor BamA [Bdellovibrionales bacterium CG22_combo_CG10-13_8_21_14_all_38_13]PIQ54713.1 MAG: outer membrane protein assembly factor BamA [Bdellovibrionales bacterium CG12_big_fil_rev_8_21_14_0_65_38_15]PIR30861.1 MAG: outer membrane protein assembly factor BamA [Bdellovibrionales bacterium CG11_big_fil_rev_8_21_14_0_20_38_13]
MPYKGQTGYKSLPVFILCIFIICLSIGMVASSNTAFAQSTNIQDLGPRKNLFKIDGIEVRGLKKVEKEAVLEKISARKGMKLDNYLLKRDLEKIYSMKFFEQVEAHQEKKGRRDILVFKVKEKPIITKITYKGNDELSEDDFKDKVKTRPFAILDVSTIQSDVIALQKLYEEKGFYLASVHFRVVQINDENVELVYDIKEYDKVRVKKVAFLGNKAFSDSQLKDIMETREESYFSWMSGSGNFKEFNFQTDIERLKYFYKTKGYLQINVATPEITVSDDKKWVFITVKVQEGPQFSVNRVKFLGEVLFPEDDLREKIKLKGGATYSEELLRQDIQLLTEMYQDEGYAFANVLRTLEVVPGENKVDIEFSFEKGKIAYFGKIIVKGNTKTRDKVVRRELKIKEGVRFSGTALRESKENVNRLGFFEQGSVVFTTVTPPGRDDVLDVEISVKERNTGQISLGAGYSTATGGFLQASIAQNNFRGLGQNLSFSLSLADQNQTFNVGFTEPYLMDTKWTAGFDIFRTNNTTSDSFSYKRKGFDVRVGYPIFDYTRLFLTYKLEDTQISAKEDPTIDEAVENGIASSVRTTLLRDRRNNTFEPTEGYYVSASTEYAGVGGDKKWWLNEVDGRHYWNLVGDLVFRSRLYAAKLERVGNQAIPRTEKLTLGGARNLRGYDFEAIGPKRTVPNVTTGQNETFNAGALFATYTTFEFEHPLAREAGLKWVVFFDAGDAGKIDQIDLKMDYGFGFRWFSPIGVLRFEFGYPINPSSTDAGSQFHFDIGQLF